MSEKPPRAIMSLAFVALLVVAVGCVGAYWYVSNREIKNQENQQRSEGNEAIMRSMKMHAPMPHTLNAKFTDADGDMIADAPEPAKQLDPETLTFSYHGGDEMGTEESWRALTEHLAQVTGKKVAYLPARNVEEQLWQLHEGKLHVTIMGSGAVPVAVNECGFVPAYTMGRDGYTMKIIVPAGSKVQRVEDIHLMTMTDVKSNSGYKIPVLLLRDMGMFVPQNYTFNFSEGHRNSIKGIKTGTYQAAAVASDVLQREVAAGTIGADEYRVIYESPAYPQAAAGYLYNLKPELVKKLRDGLATFDWKKSDLGKEFAAGKQGEFVPTNFKKDWAAIRQVTDSFDVGYQILEPAATVPAATIPAGTQAAK